MSAALVRLYRLATGTGKESQRAAATTAAGADDNEHVVEKPKLVLQLERLLAMRHGAERAPAIHCFLMHSKLSFQPDIKNAVTPYNIETTFTIGTETHRHLFAENAAVPGRLPLVLSIERISYDTTHVPVAVQLQIDGLRPQFASAADTRATRRGSARPAIQIRDDILSPQEQVVRGTRGRQLLSGALMFADAVVPHPVFSSIEAIGFDAKFFFAIATPVSDDLASRYQRLFWPQRSAFSPGSSNKSLHGGSTLPAFYWVPLTYKYTNLLVNVHGYLTVRAARSDPDFDKDSFDHTLYELPSSNNSVLFEYCALHAAVDFIEEYLIGIHPRVYPRDITLLALPFASASWQVVESQRSVLRSNAAPPSEKCMELEVEHIVYYAFFDNADEAPDSFASRSVSPELESASESSYTSSDSDDDDEDASLEFKTPRSGLAATPRMSTLAGFLDMAGNPATEGEHVRKSPLRVQQSPLRIIDTSRRTSATALTSTPPRIDFVGTALSDDCSEPSPASEAISSDTQAVAMRSILEKANRRLIAPDDS